MGFEKIQGPEVSAEMVEAARVDKEARKQDAVALIEGKIKEEIINKGILKGNQIDEFLTRLKEKFADFDDNNRRRDSNFDWFSVAIIPSMFEDETNDLFRINAGNLEGPIRNFINSDTVRAYNDARRKYINFSNPITEVSS